MTTSTRNNPPQDRLIFALDIGSGGMEEVLSWVDSLRGHVGLFKVGKEAFTIYGPALIDKIHERGARVFLDLKYHDIPNTVARAAEGAVGLGVAMFNVHAAGGRSMMAAAATAANQAAERLHLPMPLLIAVTVLTSLSDEDLREIGFHKTTMEAVLNFARMAQDAGLAGVVASPREIDGIRKACGNDFVIVTPGIRGSDAVAGDDQKRTLSPEEAITAGADYLVVGRPIRMATNPASEADRVVEAIAQGLQARGSL
ncbi:MAG TPA: orotidine-5'-phosphate decarboxylase [Syntrophus sp. (in: bacteria)]|jgi:orotidine-5'-phosphate decarboxylase|nr:orotidine-5'-phosphate decarboxylase [Syntrophus sp. (in: bacteria)]